MRTFKSCNFDNFDKYHYEKEVVMNHKQTADVKNVLARVASDTTIMSMLLEFERTLDNIDLYAYKNWDAGEIVEGPDVSRYWFTLTLMYPYKMMPDPAGAERLEKYGCKVSYQENVFKHSVRIRSREDYADPTLKTAKIKEHKVWLVKIIMPRRFIDDGIEANILSARDVDVNTDDISQAYDDGMVDEGMGEQLESPNNGMGEF